MAKAKGFSISNTSTKISTRSLRTNKNKLKCSAQPAKAIGRSLY